MRRSSFNYETQNPSTFNKNNVEDLIYRYETRKGAQLQEILSSPHLQRELDAMYYGQSRQDFHAATLMRMRLQQHNESLASLTDSEFLTDDRDDQTTGSFTKENVADNLTRLGRFLEFLSRLPLPLSFTGMGICFLLAVFISPRSCCENLLFPAFRLAFGTLYPAYASYKAVRTKNVKEYVKWMMYWIVYAFFTCIETFTDIFLSWFPFYYEFKVIIVLWLLSPATKGSSTLYRKFVHPMLTRREQEIDEYLNQAKERGYTAVLQLGSKGVNYATNVIMQTALKGGGNLVQTLRRSYSLSDLSEPDVHRTQDEMVPLASSAYGFLPHAIDETQIDEVVRPQRLRPRSQTVRSSSGGRQTMYFSEVDVEPKIPQANYNYIRSSEDISSGYSSAEPISGGLSRTSSMTNTTRPRFKAKRAEDESSAETDEYDSPAKIRTPICPSPYVTPYKFNPIQEDGRATNKDRENFEDWKDEVFFSNQKYYQEFEAVKSGGRDGIDLGAKNMTPEMRNKYEMFCKWLEDNEISKQSEEELKVEDKEENPIKLPKDSQNAVEENRKSPENDKVEEEFKDTMSTASGDDEFLDVVQENKEDILETTKENVENDEDEQLTYMDAEKDDHNFESNDQQPTEKIEESIENISNPPDAFAKVVVLESENDKSTESINPINSQIQTKPDLISDTFKLTSNFTENKEADVPAIEPQNNILEVPQNERKKSLPIENLLENLAKETEATLSVLKTNLENSGTLTSVKLDFDSTKSTTMESNLTDSSLDLSKRPANHTKGKAPEPPEQQQHTKLSKPENPSPPVPPSKPNRSEYPSSSLRESTTSLKSPESIISSVSHSRSPSPKPEGKTKTKKSLFKNYLPSIFRSDPAKQTSGLSDEYHKETQI